MDCPKCGKSFSSEQGLKIHYGRSHEGSIAGTEVSCHNCGDTFRIDPYRAEQEGVRHFCSEECRAETYSDKVELTCEWCGDTFQRVKSKIEGIQRHYCSSECKGRAYRKRVELECANCGTEIEKIRAAAIRAETHYCGDECRVEHQRGAAHPQYRGNLGLGMALRRDIAGIRWRPFRRRVLELDPEPECEICGAESSANGRALHLHHTVPIMAGGVHEPELVMFLCHPCHRAAEAFTAQRLEYPIADMVDRYGETTHEIQQDGPNVES